MSFAYEQIRALIAAGLEALPGVSADPELTLALTTFLQELQRWNKAYNLTAVREPAAMVSRHLLDSLTALPFVSGEQILDVGTGAGLPGIPLALCRPSGRFVLLDSNGKKIRFLQHVVAELGLTNVEPVQSRIEAYTPDYLFDVVICRAYTSLAGFVQSSSKLVTRGGHLLAMKGKHPQIEFEQMPADWRVSRVEKVMVPGLDAERHIVVLQRN